MPASFSTSSLSISAPGRCSSIAFATAAGSRAFLSPRWPCAAAGRASDDSRRATPTEVHRIRDSGFMSTSEVCTERCRSVGARSLLLAAAFRHGMCWPQAPGRRILAVEVDGLGWPAGFALGAAVALGVSADAAAGDHVVKVGGGTIEVSITGTPPVPVAALLQWVDTAARAVTGYLGRYPVPRVRLYVRTGRSGGIGYGTTHGGDTPTIRMDVGRDVDEGDLRDDWILTHEMVHLAFPDLTTDDRWAEEGLATYVEPVARARLGVLSEDEVWSGLIDGLPKGQGRGSLHATHEWGPTYWGGALYWLLADVTI